MKVLDQPPPLAEGGATVPDGTTIGDGTVGDARPVDFMVLAIEQVDAGMRTAAVALKWAMEDGPDPSGMAPERLAGLRTGMAGIDQRFLRRTVLVLDAMPMTWEAFQEGQLSWSQTAGIVRAVAHLPRADRSRIDVQLTGALDAGRDDPDRVIEIARDLADALDEERQRDRAGRELDQNVLIIQEAFCGGGKMYAELDAHATAVLMNALDAAADAPVSDDDPEPTDAEGNVIPKAWRPPTRRGAQHAEALVRICHAYLGGGTDGSDANVRARPSCQIVFDHTLMTEGAGGRLDPALGGVSPATAVLFWRLVGGRRRISRLVAETLACDATLIPLLTDRDSPLAIGDAHDPIPTAVRRAAQARDQRCRFPGCAAPVGWTDLHHILPRLEGGPTELANLVSMCRYHHLMVHEKGWNLDLADDGTLTVIRGRYRFTSRPRLRPPPPVRRQDMSQPASADLPF